MIKVIDDWYVTVETNPVNYVVRRGKGEKDAKNSWRDKPYGFFEACGMRLGLSVTKLSQNAFQRLPAPFPRLSALSQRRTTALMKS